MKRKIIVTLLILVIVSPILNSVCRAYIDPEYQKYGYKDDGNGGKIISMYYGSETSVNIPSEVNGKKVTGIGEYAFTNNSKVVSITIPEGVTYIDNAAFSRCTNLKNITIPESVTSIKESVFYGCRKLENIELPKGLIYLGGGAFNDCSSLTSVLIPEGVTMIGGRTFCECSNLTSIIIPEKVTSIRYSAFLNCSNLTSITIPESVTSIAFRAFEGCSSLTSINIPEEVTNIEHSAFLGCNSLTSINIPKSVTSIEENTYSGCSSLESVTIPENVISIANSAFADCSNLSSIIIPKSVTSIESDAFARCDSLTIYTYRGSYAQTYGNENNINVVLLDDDHGENHEYGEWQAGETTHKKECECGSIIEEAHIGGTATCTKKAICEVCAIEYGNIDSLNHVNMETRNIVEATREKAGYTGDIYCKDCGILVKVGEVIPKVEGGLGDETESPIIVSKPFPFIDVKETDWYYNSVKFVYDRDIILGTTATTFKPNNNLTRGNLVTILWRMEGSPSNINGKEFPDVKSSEYYYNAVKWAVSKKIASGHEDGKFRPNTYITRQQLSVMLYNYAKYKGRTGKTPTSITQYVDYRKVNDYAIEAVGWAIANKIISGKENGTQIAPQGNATRAETAAMIQNYLTYVK